MKVKPIVFALIAVVLLAGLYARRKYFQANPSLEVATTVGKEDPSEIKDGDLIFQTSLSGQSRAIQLATHSEYSHCGIIYKEGDSYYVFEAVQPVKRTPLVEWIARGENGKYVIRRLKGRDKVLTPEVISRMKDVGAGFAGKDYDLVFEWSDDKMYCSELIWKVYERATGLEIGVLQKLKDFDLTNELVRAKVEERYGKNIPGDEFVISPKSVFNSKLLMTVKANE